MKPVIQPFGQGSATLRLLAEADLPLTLEWRNLEEVRRWFRFSEVVTEQQHRQWFARYLTLDDDLVFVVECEGRAVGQVSIYRIDRLASVAEVGRFLIAPSAQGRGLFADACGALLRFASESLGLGRVELEVKEENLRAISIYQRAGFHETGRREGYVWMERVLGQVDGVDANAS